MLRLIQLDFTRRGLRTGLAATGVAVGVAAVVALLALGNGIEKSAAGLANLGNAELGLFQGGRGDLTASRLPQGLADDLRGQPGVEDAAPVLVLTDQLPDESSFLLFGVDPQSFVMRRLVFRSGGPPLESDQVALGDAASSELDLSVGNSLELAGDRVRISGVYHAGVPFEDQGGTLPLRIAQEAAGSGDDVTTIAVAAAPGTSADELGERLEETFPGTVAISEPGQVVRADTNALLVSQATIVLGAVALLVGAIVVMNTTLISVLEREKEFALLIAVGWPVAHVVRLVIGQAITLGLLGAAIGVPLGLLAGALAPKALGASALVNSAPSGEAVAVALATALGMGILGSFYPAWRVTRLRPAQVLG